MHDEMERARQTLHRLLDDADPADLRRRSNGTRWTNQQLLFHMLFGYLIVRRQRPLVLLFGRLPDPASRIFAAGLNAATKPFHLINYLGSVCGGTVLRPARIAGWMDRTIQALHQRLDTETDTDLGRVMHFPPAWDPYFADTMTLRVVYHYATQHFDHHCRQLILPSTTEP